MWVKISVGTARNVQFQPELMFLQNWAVKTKLKRTQYGPGFYFAFQALNSKKVGGV